MHDEHSKTSDPAVGSTRLLADLESRVDAAWSAYIAACQKARRDREAIDATVYEARHKWDELNRELKQATSANSMVGPRSHDQWAIPLDPKLSCAKS